MREAGSGESVTWWLVILPALVPAAVKWLCYPHNIGSDDAYIHLRIATNFAHGLGWGINPHQPVNLSTSPAFTLLLAAVELGTAHAVGVAQVLSCVAVALGLGLIFLATRAETGSARAGLFAEVAAAFSVNLWRWNGALMEATFGFAVVATVLYLYRQGAPRGARWALAAGVVLGVGVLLRPEMGLLVCLALVMEGLRARSVLGWAARCGAVLLGVATVLTPWCVFAWREMGGVVPTTFAAKSTAHLLWWNGRILQQFGESVFESLLFPSLLVLGLLLLRAVVAGWKARTPDVGWWRWPGLGGAEKLARSWSAYVLPVGWVVGLFAFYYLKTPGLQSTGRYVLPLLPCEAVLLGFAWSRLTASTELAAGCRADGLQRHWLTADSATASFVCLHVLFAIVLNYLFVMPVLRRFEGEYAATMRAAASELAERVVAGPNRRVLVVEDIGVLSYAAAGRFEIYDGGALATPSLRGLSLREQIDRVRPAYVLESLAPSPEGFGPGYGDQLSAVWKRRFRQHSVRKAQPFYYTILYRDTNGSRGTGTEPLRSALEGPGRASLRAAMAAPSWLDGVGAVQPGEVSH